MREEPWGSHQVEARAEKWEISEGLTEEEDEGLGSDCGCGCGCWGCDDDWELMDRKPELISRGTARDGRLWRRSRRDKDRILFFWPDGGAARWCGIGCKVDDGIRKLGMGIGKLATC